MLSAFDLGGGPTGIETNSKQCLGCGIEFRFQLKSGRRGVHPADAAPSCSTIADRTRTFARSAEDRGVSQNYRTVALQSSSSDCARRPSTTSLISWSTKIARGRFVEWLSRGGPPHVRRTECHRATDEAPTLTPPCAQSAACAGYHHPKQEDRRQRPQLSHRPCDRAKFGNPQHLQQASQPTLAS